MTLVYKTVPDPPVISVVPTATSIKLFGGVPNDSLADGYEVKWERDTTVGCSKKHTGKNYTIEEITGLYGDSLYIITVIAFNGAGSSKKTVTAMTLEAGQI